MANYYFPVKWEISSSVMVKAETKEEAIKRIKDDFGSMLPDDYIHDIGSVVIEEELGYEV